MDSTGMVSYGLALRAYFDGVTDAELTIRRDDGREDAMPVAHFFRSPDQFSPIETLALECCRGHVLDIGAGTGIHSLALSERGLRVTAIDVNRDAVEIMKDRGVPVVYCRDVYEFDNGPFDTLLILGHGIGMVQDLPGLDRFLERAVMLTHSEGQVLIHSLDVRVTDDAGHRAYHEVNRAAGRYRGEIRFAIRYAGTTGPFCRWLHVDGDTLEQRAERAGWEAEVVLDQPNGEYLARLTRPAATRLTAFA